MPHLHIQPSYIGNHRGEVFLRRGKGGIKEGYAHLGLCRLRHVSLLGTLVPPSSAGIACNAHSERLPPSLMAVSVLDSF